MFVDQAKIYIKAGDGGDGAVSFHREKYVAAGGPDGGDGGKGGDIVFVVDDNISNLIDFRYKRKYVAEKGQNGGGKNCSGRNAPDLVVKVPRGTVVKEIKSGRILAFLPMSLLLSLTEARVGVETLILPLPQGRYRSLQSRVSVVTNMR